MGVITRKKTMPITIGAIKDPNKIPNLNHNKFKGVNNLELIIPKVKKIKDIITDQILTSPLFNKGQEAIIKKTTKKTIPKLLFELILILDLFCMVFYMIILKKKLVFF